jgi:hypothetical protein
MASTSVKTSSLNTFSKFDNTSAGNFTSQFIATGASGTILTSPDGITWTTRSSSIPVGNVAAPHRNRNLYCVFDNSYNRWTSSDNGVTWAKNGQAAGNAYGATLTYVVNAKPDAVDGTINLFPNMVAVVSGNGGSMFDVTNATGVGDNIVQGTNWGAYDYATNGSAWLIAGANSSSAATPPYLLRSSTTKGGQLSSISYGVATSVASVAWGNNTFALTTGNGLGVYTSPTGVTWTSQGQSFQPMTFQNNLFLGYSGTSLSTSSNAVTWTPRTVTGLVNNIAKIVYGAGLYVLIANGGVIYSSPDAITWTARTSGTANDLRGLYYG